MPPASSGTKYVSSGIGSCKQEGGRKRNQLEATAKYEYGYQNIPLKGKFCLSLQVGNGIMKKMVLFQWINIVSTFAPAKKIYPNLYTSVLKKEAACSSETSISTYKTIRCHNPEGQEYYNLKDLSCIACEFFNPGTVCSMFLRNVGFRL